MASLELRAVRNAQQAHLSLKTGMGNAMVELKTETFRVTGWPVEVFLNCTGAFWFLQIGSFSFGAITAETAEKVKHYLQREFDTAGIEWSSEV